MKCLACNFDNPGTAAYCKKCGKKLNLTHEEIQSALKEKAAGESAKNVEYQTRQILVVAIAFFVLTLTLRIVAAGMRPDETHLVFSSAVSIGDKATYAEVPYDFMPPLELENCFDPLVFPKEPAGSK